MSDTLSIFDPLVAAWFATRFEQPTEPQAGGWREIAAGRDVLLPAPTGSGLRLAPARSLRPNGLWARSRDLFARPHQFVYRPTDLDRFYEMTLVVADEAQQARQYQTAYNIARQVDDALPIGVTIAAQPYDIRDKYTSITWLGGRVVALGPVGLPRVDRVTGGAADYALHILRCQRLNLLSSRTLPGCPVEPKT